MLVKEGPGYWCINCSVYSQLASCLSTSISRDLHALDVPCTLTEFVFLRNTVSCRWQKQRNLMQIFLLTHSDIDSIAILRMIFSNPISSREIFASRISAMIVSKLLVDTPITLVMTTTWWWLDAFQWCHIERNDVSNHQYLDCLLNRLFRRRPKKTSKLWVTDLYEWNHRSLVNSPHKGPVTRKMVSFDDIIRLRSDNISSNSTKFKMW